MAEPAAPGRRVFIETHGCTTNMGDSQTMAGILAAAGHEIVARVEDADLLVLNTCTVTQTTDQRMTHRLSEWRATGKDVIAAGCMAAARPEAVSAVHPNARLLPPRHLDQVDRLAAGDALADSYRTKTGLPRLIGTDAAIPLAEGCLFSCTYCLTKSARGDQESHPLRALVTDIRAALNAGAVEVKLTSQDTSGYGLDIGTDLAELITEIRQIGGEFRIRAGMMHPKTAHRILDPLLDAMHHPKVYQFLHLPVQSGSARILKAMKRGHTLDEFIAVATAFRDRFPRGILATDVITGYPGETRTDHAATLRLLHDLAPEHVNVTRWSSRPGTPAATAPGRLPTAKMKARSRQTLHHLLDIWSRRMPRRIGETTRILVTEPGKKEGTVLGRGPAYEPIAIPHPLEVPIPCLLPVRITATRPTYLLASPIGPPQAIGKAFGTARLSGGTGAA